MKYASFILIAAFLAVTCRGSVFDYGIATRGPLSIQGNMHMDGVNISIESDTYIESLADSNALEIIGNSQIAGDVKIVNPDASVVLLGGAAGIGGEVGQDAIDHHVEFGAPMLVFPYPDTAHFTQYLSGETLTESYPGGGVYKNIKIAAGTNPHFSYDVELKGIIYIEQPNVVTFSGNVDITGIIVAAGDPLDNSGTNTIDFLGTITSHSITTLDDTFDSDLEDETGTFLIAPGFNVSFGEYFDYIDGIIAANGITFYGAVGGTIGGSILNYSDQPMIISGSDDLYFSRWNITDAPAGFAPWLKLNSPNAGENLTAGQQYPIRWFGNEVIGDVLIEYSIDNGSNWVDVEAPNASNTGLYNWTVPLADSNECLVRISSVLYPSISDISDAPFTISPPYTCTAELPADINEDCKVDLLDFAVFVDSWLECHREPIETCYQ